jgi:hypothetical protein
VFAGNPVCYITLAAPHAYIHGMVKPAFIATAKPRRSLPVLLCKKCLKRAANGGAIKRALKSVLKETSRGRGEKRARLVMAGCFGLCPKRAVTAASGTTLARGEYLLLTDEDQAAEAVSRLTDRAT